MTNKITLFLLFLLIFALPSYSQDKDKSVLLYDTDKKEIIYSENKNTQLIPASTIKILTALAAAEKLGISYRFSTEVYTDNYRNIYVKGFGDPLFISQEINKFCEKTAKNLEHNNYNNIILDQSYFSPAVIQFQGTRIKSIQPYDSPNNALAANFNSICFKKTGSNYISCEKQTPLIKKFLPLIKKSGLESGRIPLTANNNSNLTYPGYLIKYFLEQNKININGKIKHFKAGLSYRNKTKVIDYKSGYTLEDIIEKMLFYSNNFIANQIFLKLGKNNKEYTDEISARKYLNNFLEKNGINAVISEGSGISRSNRISANEMLKIMIDFYPYYKLLKNENEQNFYKTGTLSNVRNLCGYYINKNNKVYIYIIFQNNTNDDPWQELKKIMTKADKKG
jgi:D-alanyl-D-alanine carboxypeptidase/D-alanyl-D-alanine-endopeptidase (penicillin-binding protein 4)